MNKYTWSLHVIFLIIYFFLGSVEISTANISYYSSFSQISQKDGLPNNLVECMLQDYTGYMWFGTKRGLCKYDGYEFTNYRSSINDSTSLPYHHVTALLESSDSTLWVGLWRNGLCKYNREQDNFSAVNFQKTTFPKTLIIKQILEDSKNKIWVIHQFGVIILNLSGDVLKVIDNSFLKGLDEISAIFETKDKELLIAAGSNIYSYNSILHSFVQIENSCDLPIGTIHQFYQYNDQTLWLAGDYGLLSYDLNRKTIFPIVKSMDMPYRFIFEDKQENIWSGASFPLCYKKQSDEIQFYNKLPEQSATISGNYITCGMIDNQNNLWFGNTNNGVSILHNNRTNFNSYPNVQKFIKENAINVTSVFRDKEGMLFIGTLNRGFLMFDNNGKKIAIGNKNPCLSDLENPSRFVRDIKSDHNGRIWFGSNGKDGITIYDPENNRCEKYEYSISSFLFDSKGNSWIGEADGLILFENDKKRVTKLNYKNEPIIGISSMLEDKEDNIWIASYDNGLFISNIYEKMLVKANDKYKNLPETKCISLLIDSRGRMWLGTEFYGLYYKNPDQVEFKKFTQKDGLPSNDICSILEDKNGNIWIGTNHGLSRFNYTTKRFKNFFIDDGLIGDEFNYNALFIEGDGVLLFGTTSGLVAFDPDNIEDDNQSLPLVINEVKVNNGTVMSDVFGLSIREALINQKPVTLNHNQNTISINFSTINFSSSKKCQYAYILKGSDEDYHYVGDQRQVTYTKLPPGEYVFSVKASNNDNIWGEKEAAFSFNIRQHPMKSSIAYALYFLFLCLIAVIVFQIIRHQNRLKNKIIIGQLAKEQQEDLINTKLRFFTNISHEFKTPLSLIISPLEELLEELHGNSSVKKKLTQIRVNSQRLLTLINQLIEFRKMEQDVLPVNYEDLNILDITQNAMTFFSNMAEQRNIYFELKTSMQECSFNSDKDKIEKIFNNILSNAFKHTTENGTITVSLKLIKNCVQVSIKDTGTGISKQNLEHIFDRFYQKERTNQISGIGMAYVKKIIELLNGTIEVNSEINKGTEVVFTIPNANRAPVAIVFNKSVTNTATDYRHKEVYLSNGNHNEEVKPDSPRLLVVEDDYDVRKHLCSILQKTYNIDEAENGAISYEMIKKTDYNLVLSDIMMPKMDGLELCSKIKSNPKTNHVIVILLSAIDEIETEMEGYKAGANAYISKPFFPQKLLLIIKNQLYTQQKGIGHHSDTNPKDAKILIGVDQTEKEFIDQVTLFIEENLYKQNFGIEQIGKEFGLSRSSLYKKFKVITNVSLKDYIKEIRMKKAARLLKENNLTACVIAYDLGFSSATNFFTAFKAFYGKTPKQFQKENVN